MEMVYDSAGNLVEQRNFDKHLVKQMRYDSYNRIVEVMNPEASSDYEQIVGRYSYDDTGFRVRKVVSRDAVVGVGGAPPARPHSKRSVRTTGLPSRAPPG